MWKRSSCQTREANCIDENLSNSHNHQFKKLRSCHGFVKYLIISTLYICIKAVNQNAWRHFIFIWYSFRQFHIHLFLTKMLHLRIKTRHSNRTFSCVQTKICNYKSVQESVITGVYECTLVNFRVLKQIKWSTNVYQSTLLRDIKSPLAVFIS